MKQQVLGLMQRYSYPFTANDLKLSIRMKTLPRQEEMIALGATKVGGSPDVPEEMKWPDWQDFSLPFIAQLRLQDLEPYDIGKCLPRTGMLYFFFDIDCYFSSPEALSWKVFYYDGLSSHLHRTPLPHPAPVLYEDLVMPACEVIFSPEITIPPFDSLFTKHIALQEDYFDLLEEVQHFYDTQQRPAIHRVLGHPDAIQNDMQVQCQQRWLQKNNIPLSNKQVFEEEARKWVLLLQISPDKNIERNWSDNGKLYYWIRPEDLKACRFDRVQFIHQCY